MKRFSLFLVTTLTPFAEEPIEILDPIVAAGKAEDILGEVSSANEGRANYEELSQRPTVRRGELLEVIPGVIVTQHAGGGKANQYFILGYNLDHGTDFHIGVDGMPGATSPCADQGARYAAGSARPSHFKASLRSMRMFP